jgi:hypothetical protein
VPANQGFEYHGRLLLSSLANVEISLCVLFAPSVFVYCGLLGSFILLSLNMSILGDYALQSEELGQG